MPLSPGDKLGPYEILGLLGKGGMGEVYRAHDDRLRRDVAIKVSNAQFTERFEREARAVAALNHPNICHIYDVGPNYLVMELIEGPTLGDRIKEGAIPLDEALAIATQIGAALEAAHEKTITHRDLKPGNVKIRPDGVVKVLDFGLAKIGGIPPATVSEDSPTLSMAATQAGMILGTAAYMAPEQAKGKPVDKRADIWAFGVVLYEMVTGKRPFQGDEIVEVLAAVVHGQPDLTAVPQRLRRLIGKCLEKDPNKRLRDMGGMEFLLAEEASAPVVIGAAPKNRLVWPLVAATILALGALATVSMMHFREPAPEVVKLEFSAPDKSILVEGNGPPAVSPDGKQIVFRAASDGKQMLWVRDLNSLTARVLPGTESPNFPFWSPDSRSVAFFSAADGRGKLLKVDVTGGPALTIALFPQTPRGGSWSQNGTIILGSNIGVQRVSATGGTPSPLALNNEGNQRYPHFLPDGRHYLYLGASADAERSAIFVGDLESRERKLLFPAESNAVYVEPGYLLFVREQSLMAQPYDTSKIAVVGDAFPVAEQVDYSSSRLSGYFSASRNGVLAYASGGLSEGLQITWFDRSGKVVGTVGKLADLQTPRLSPDGKMIATDRRDPSSRNRDIWIHDLIRGTEQRLTFANNNTEPVWSPDGKRVAYVRRNDDKVVAKAADGTGEEEIMDGVDKFLRPMDWTRDGGFLLLATGNANPKTGNDVLALPLTGKNASDRKLIPVKTSEFEEFHARLSPDGRWLAYQSNQSKRTEVYVVPFPATASGEWQVSVDGGRLPVWSRDGRELYFVNGPKLWAVEIKPGAQFQAGVPKPLFDVRVGTSNPSYDVSADGRFLFATPVESTATVPMTVVLNWQAALKK